MYLLYESLYGDLLCENDSTDIIGLYDTKEKALEKAQKLIKEYITDLGFVLDSEKASFEKSKFRNTYLVRLFQSYQENWNSFFEIIIEEIELNKE